MNCICRKDPKDQIYAIISVTTRNGAVTNYPSIVDAVTNTCACY